MNSSKKINDADTDPIDPLVEKLNDKDGLIRQHARLALVRIGEPALPALLKAFEKKGDIIHWEVTKALSQIGSSEAAEILVTALDDREFSVRWIAAEGLIQIGYDALGPLLTALNNRSDSVWLREGAHHVLHDLIGRRLIDDTDIQLVSPILDALNHINPEVELISTAARVLGLIGSR